MKQKRFLTFLFFTFCTSSSLFLSAQSFQFPLKIQPTLSANFGELRTNHFHAGIDIKTNGRINLSVYSIGDGYVSRVRVGAGGYGLVLYVTHPSGYVSVYAHLNKFIPRITSYVKKKQYEKENFELDIPIAKNMFPVKKGEQIAFSGNTGGSGGPHLHLEMRKEQSQNPVDPLKFLGKFLSDTEKPIIRKIIFYPSKGKGSVNGSDELHSENVTYDAKKHPVSLKRTVNGWGEIALGLQAFDKMNNQHNLYGVKRIRLFVDDRLVFGSSINELSYSKMRMINSFIDFEIHRKKHSYYMKSFLEPGNTLHFYESIKNQGYITIGKEKIYRLRYELTDCKGNKEVFSFSIKGKKQPIVSESSCPKMMKWNRSNSFSESDFSLNIPSGNLYDDFCFSYEKSTSDHYFSDIHRVNDKPIPLNRKAKIWIKLLNDQIKNRRQYGIVRISEGKDQWEGGSYVNGGVEVAIKELGDSYAIDIDTVAPQIIPVANQKWSLKKQIRIRLIDDKSGIASFRGEVDGHYLLFTHDVKSNDYIYNFDEYLPEEKNFTLRFRAKDKAGNTTSCDILCSN